MWKDYDEYTLSQQGKEIIEVSEYSYHPLNVDEIRNSLGGTNYASMRKMLSIMAKDGQINRTGRV